MQNPGKMYLRIGGSRDWKILNKSSINKSSINKSSINKSSINKSLTIVLKRIMNLRIGQGFDAHKFTTDRPLILGGVKIPHKFGLAGHSDADVLVHAVIDALLGALSLGDIGKWFPDNDAKYKNINSMKLLEQVLNNKIFKNWTIVNLDATIITQQPKLSKHTPLIQQKLALALNSETEQISIKAKTTEGMGFCGRSEGIAVLVNLLLQKKCCDTIERNT